MEIIPVLPHFLSFRYTHVTLSPQFLILALTAFMTVIKMPFFFLF